MSSWNLPPWRAHPSSSQSSTGGPCLRGRAHLFLGTTAPRRRRRAASAPSVLCRSRLCRLVPTRFLEEVASYLLRISSRLKSRYFEFTATPLFALHYLLGCNCLAGRNHFTLVFVLSCSFPQIRSLQCSNSALFSFLVRSGCVRRVESNCNLSVVWRNLIACDF